MTVVETMLRTTQKFTALRRDELELLVAYKDCEQFHGHGTSYYVTHKVAILVSYKLD